MFTIMPARKYSGKVSKHAALLRRRLYMGKVTKSAGGRPQSAFKKNRTGRIVSKVWSENGKRHEWNILPFSIGLRAARIKLDIVGFKPAYKGTPLHALATQIATELRNGHVREELIQFNLIEDS